MDENTGGAIFAVVALVVFAVILVPFIFYLLTLQKAFSRVAPQHRELSPGLVWLMFIPLFGLVWHFIIAAKLSNSLRKEFASRNADVVGESYGWTIGLIMCILMCTTWIPILGFLTAIGAIVLWIIYWVKIANFSARLAKPA